MKMVKLLVFWPSMNKHLIRPNDHNDHNGVLSLTVMNLQVSVTLRRIRCGYAYLAYLVSLLRKSGSNPMSFISEVYVAFLSSSREAITNPPPEGDLPIEKVSNITLSKTRFNSTNTSSCMKSKNIHSTNLTEVPSPSHRDRTRFSRSVRVRRRKQVAGVLTGVHKVPHGCRFFLEDNVRDRATDLLPSRCLVVHTRRQRFEVPTHRHSAALVLEGGVQENSHSQPR